MRKQYSQYKGLPMQSELREKKKSECVIGNGLIDSKMTSHDSICFNSFFYFSS